MDAIGSGCVSRERVWGVRPEANVGWAQAAARQGVGRLRCFGIVGALLLLAAAVGSEAEPPAGKDSGWLERVQQTLAAREYEASPNHQGLQAPNRVHNLRTYFEPTGIRVADRTAAGSPELVALRLSRVGRGEALAPVAAGQVSSMGARVEIRRPGLVEWYVNGPSGLEQGFTLETRPEGEGSVVLELAVDHARARLAGENVVFSTSAGRQLMYGKLAVSDAAGSPLAASFEVPQPDRLRIVLADADALYPVIVDPLLAAPAAAQIESSQPEAYLGSSVAGAGDVNGDGYADVIVGAYRYDAGETDEGAAFVFHGSATGIPDGSPANADAQIESNQAGARLGESVAGAGDVNGDGYDDVIVGASFYNAGEIREGAAFVFHGSAIGVLDGSPATADAQLESNDPAGYLGSSVAGAGDVNGDGYADVIVGASFYDAGETNEGAAFVFHGSATGIPDGSPATADTQLESNQAGAQLGSSVAGAGDVNGDGYADVIVGAHRYDAGETDEGAAFVFHGSATGIAGGSPVSADTQLESNQAFASLGVSVAGAGDVNGDGYADVIVGAPNYDAGEPIEGAVFVFHGSATGVSDGSPASADTQLESNQAFASLGVSVAGAGDVNGDGYDDVIVGAPNYDAGESIEGAAFVFHGSATGSPDGSVASAAAQLEADQARASVGSSVAGAGDVNGDGYADVIVGAPNYGAGEALEGAAFVFHGSATGLVPDTDSDGILDPLDNCPDLANPDQRDTDGNGTGDACNEAEDLDGDEWSDPLDNCPDVANPDQADTDGNGTGDACNEAEDLDGDEWSDPLDNCPDVANPDQADFDDDGVGDACDGSPWLNVLRPDPADLTSLRVEVRLSDGLSPEVTPFSETFPLVVVGTGRLSLDPIGVSAPEARINRFELDFGGPYDFQTTLGTPQIPVALTLDEARFTIGEGAPSPLAEVLIGASAPIQVATFDGSVTGQVSVNGTPMPFSFYGQDFPCSPCLDGTTPAVLVDSLESIEVTGLAGESRNSPIRLPSQEQVVGVAEGLTVTVQVESQIQRATFAVPEPTAILLQLVAIVGAGLLARRR